MSPSKLALGTVQFGLDYGVSNEQGRPDEAEVERILATAHAGGIRLLDSAAGYGDSEQVLGRSAQARAFDVVTKTIEFNTAVLPPDAGPRVRAGFLRSLERLRRERVYGLLAHAAGDLLALGGDKVYEALLALKREGLAARIGVSCYTPQDVAAVLERFAVDLVQVPYNVLDQRLCTSGALGELKRRGVEVHARSAFLQGLLLTDPARAPAHFEPIRPLLQRFRTDAAAAGHSPITACLSHALATPGIDVVVCGTNTVAELAGLLAAADARDSGFDVSAYAIEDTRFIHPQEWPRKT